MYPFFVTGTVRSGKSTALAHLLIEALGLHCAMGATEQLGASPEGEAENHLDGSLEFSIPARSAIWVSAHRLSAEAFRSDLARDFPELAGRVRITTPRGLAYSAVSGSPLVVCDDVDSWQEQDLALVGLLLGSSPAPSVGPEGVGPRLFGVSADADGPRFAHAVALWPELETAAGPAAEVWTPVDTAGPLTSPKPTTLTTHRQAGSLAPATRSRIVSSHRSLTSESVVQILSEGHRGGIDWHDMAVVVRNRGATNGGHGATSELLGALRRSGRRVGIQFTEPRWAAAADPLVRRWLRLVDQELGLSSQGESKSSSRQDPLLSVATVPSAGALLEDLLFGVWEREIARLALVAGAPTIAACHAILRDVQPVDARNVDTCREELRRLMTRSWVNAASGNQSADPHSALDSDGDGLDKKSRDESTPGADKLGDDKLGADKLGNSGWDFEWEPITNGSTVAVLTPSELLGRQYALMVVVGLAEGSWPRTFDASGYRLESSTSRYLEGQRTSPNSERDAGEAQNFLSEGRAALARHVRNEEALFLRSIARASSFVVAVSAPEPGVLISRFIEDWPNHTFAYRSKRRAVPLPALAETPGVVPCFPDGRLRLSASQLSTFENCPQNFAYQYVAAVRGSGSVQASVGTMVHEALERYLAPPPSAQESQTQPNERKLAALHSDGPQLRSASSPISEPSSDRQGGSGILNAAAPLVPYPPIECGLTELLACLDDAWDSTAFAYRPQEADYRRRAEDWLRTWWENELPKIAQVVAVEHRFTITVGDDDEHVLVGSIDRVSVDPNGNLEIVDYKTGTPPAGSVDEEDLQLATYHLAVNNDPAFSGVGEPDRLRLHFLQNGKDIDQPIQANHAEITSARIAFRANEILTETFRPSVDADCQYCAFQRACPIQPLGAEVGS
jgi:PD-(D/E)XK nuclease superfamily